MISNMPGSKFMGNILSDEKKFTQRENMNTLLPNSALMKLNKPNYPTHYLLSFKLIHLKSLSFKTLST